MRDLKMGPFVSLVEVVERLAGSNYSGEQTDVDRKEALDDVLAALRDGAMRAQGTFWKTNETGRRWLTNRTGDPEQITPSHWRIFEYRIDENQLLNDDSGSVGDTYQATWIEDIEVDRVAAEKLWPGRISTESGLRQDRN